MNVIKGNSIYSGNKVHGIFISSNSGQEDNLERKGLGWVGRLGHRIADYSPQNGVIFSKLIPLMWRIGYKKE